MPADSAGLVTSMRRRNGKAARNFYVTHEVTRNDEANDEFGLAAAEEEKPLLETKSPPSSIAILACLRNAVTSISAGGGAMLLMCTRCCVGDMDLLNHCGQSPPVMLHRTHAFYVWQWLARNHFP
jgi:hypothetical protein